MEEASDEENWRNNSHGYNEMHSHNYNMMNEEIFCRDDYYSHDDEPEESFHSKELDQLTPSRGDYSFSQNDEREESFHSQELDQLTPAREDYSFSQNEDYEWSSERDAESTNSGNNEMITPENRTAREQISESIDATPQKLGQKKDSRKNKGITRRVRLKNQKILAPISISSTMLTTETMETWYDLCVVGTITDTAKNIFTVEWSDLFITYNDDKDYSAMKLQNILEMNVVSFSKEEYQDKFIQYKEMYKEYEESLKSKKKEARNKKRKNRAAAKERAAVVDKSNKTSKKVTKQSKKRKENESNYSEKTSKQAEKEMNQLKRSNKESMNAAKQPKKRRKDASKSSKRTSKRPEQETLANDTHNSNRRMRVYERNVRINFDSPMGECTQSTQRSTRGTNKEYASDYESEDDDDNFKTLERGGKAIVDVVYDINGEIIEDTLSENIYTFAAGTDEFEEFPDTFDEDAIAHGDGGIALSEEDQVSDPDSRHNKHVIDIIFEDFLPEDTRTFKKKPHHMAEEKSSLEATIPEDTFTKGALQCFFYVSGMDEDYFKRMATTMTQYAFEKMKKNGRSNGTFAGASFSKKNPFNHVEMIRFMGILLKISLDGRRRGGYKQYWVESKRTVTLGRGLSRPVQGHTTWAKDIMDFKRFKQILSGLRTVGERAQNVEDKAYQLRHACQAISTGASRTFRIGRYMSFDEGGVASRSRYNPIRQYNKDKPQKFRVDFFVLAAADNYFVYHMEPYQGKNASNAFIR